MYDDGTNEVLFQHLDNRAAVVPDSGEEVFFEINGERVSEEEYNKAVEENMSIETISYYEGIRMTKENIDKHCK
ncbi:MAG: hypothetical protein IJE48_08215 [Clostridia bacterium]|nr:hypothetical protein [Clostridia bacterium]